MHDYVAILSFSEVLTRVEIWYTNDIGKYHGLVSSGFEDRITVHVSEIGSTETSSSDVDNESCKVGIFVGRQVSRSCSLGLKFSLTYHTCACGRPAQVEHTNKAPQTGTRLRNVISNMLLLDGA